MIATCRQCGRDYRTFPSYLKRRPSGHFCSRACRTSFCAVHAATRPCRGCGAPMAAAGQRVYCGAACRKQFQARRWIERFYRSFRKTSTCWIWTGHVLGNGYGAHGKRYAHRFSWELAHGRPITNGQHVLHACDRPLCVNPAHLFLGTAKDNHDDAVQKGRKVWPPKRAPKTVCINGHALTDENVRTWGGNRACRLCQALRSQRYYQRKLQRLAKAESHA